MNIKFYDYILGVKSIGAIIFLIIFYSGSSIISIK